MVPAAVFSTHAARSCRPGRPLEEAAARQHSRKQAMQQLPLPAAPAPACCTAVFATHCTAVLRVTGRLTPGCGQTRQGGASTAIHISNGLGDASLPVPHLHRHHTAFKIDPKVLHRERSAALQHNPSTPWAREYPKEGGRKPEPR